MYSGKAARIFFSMSLINSVGLCVVFSLDVNLCRDEDVRRPEMDSLDIDETVYFISVEGLLDTC